MANLSCTVEVKFDSIGDIVDEIKTLQTYKLSADDDLLLVSRSEVIDILANHVVTKFRG